MFINKCITRLYNILPCFFLFFTNTMFRCRVKKNNIDVCFCGFCKADKSLKTHKLEQLDKLKFVFNKIK